MKHSQINQVEKLSRAIDRGSIKATMLCEPNLVAIMISALKKAEVPETDVGDYDEMEKLAKAAQGKKASSKEYAAFSEACDTKKIKKWCEQCLEIFKLTEA